MVEWVMARKVQTLMPAAFDLGTEYWPQKLKD